jgi:hypothetical protein
MLAENRFCNAERRSGAGQAAVLDYFHEIIQII